jgi:mRNA cleavage and polyadenylation factor I complex, subunit RNA14, putative (fragment)
MICANAFTFFAQKRSKFSNFNLLVIFAALVPGSHSVAGGIFPPPPAVGLLLSQLPHPSSYHGPFVMVDELMNLFHNAKQIDTNPDKPPPSFKADSSASASTYNLINGPKLFETSIKASLQFNSNINSSSNADKVGLSNKRSTPLDDDEDEVEGENSNPLNPPSFDIYRTRQLQKRVK